MQFTKIKLVLKLLIVCFLSAAAHVVCSLNNVVFTVDTGPGYPWSLSLIIYIIVQRMVVWKARNLANFIFDSRIFTFKVKLKFKAQV